MQQARHNNFIINNEFVLPSDQNLIFGPLEEDETVILRDNTTTVVDLLVECGFFASKGQARKAGWEPILPTGFSTWTIGKKNRTLTIWNPTQ